MIACTIIEQKNLGKIRRKKKPIVFVNLALFKIALTKI
jgi:hypothetical protein